MPREWLTELIREVHIASRGTYDYRRVHAELTMGMGVAVAGRLVGTLMSLSGLSRLSGLPGPTRVNRLRAVGTVGDLVNRKFHRHHLSSVLRRLLESKRAEHTEQHAPIRVGLFWHTGIEVAA